MDSIFGKKLLKTISYFYIWDCYSFSGVRILSGTTLKDIEDIFSKTFFESYYFACPYRTTDGEKNAAVFRIVRCKKEHERFLRSNLKFIPKDTYVLEWRESTATIYWPFIQKDDGSVIHLFLNPLYRKGWSELSRQQKTFMQSGEHLFPVLQLPKIIERLPDLAGSMTAKIKYNGVDICIPIAEKTAVTTFKNRDKDGGVKRRLIHGVDPYARKNLKNSDKVSAHLRGQSDFIIKGVQVSLIASPIMSYDFYWKKEEK